MVATNTTVRLFVVLSLFSLSACTFIDVREEVRYNQNGKIVADSLVRIIKPGVTTADWVLERFGEPQTKVQAKDSPEIWTYQIEEQRYKRTRILFLFRYRSLTTVPRYISLIIEDNIVKKVRQDKADEAMAVYERDV